MTVRNVPSALQTHLNLNSTTTCRLLKFRTKQGQFFGLTNLDRDVVYDDGESSDGELIYSATNGFDPSAIAADLGYSVGNSEGYALISDQVAGVTAEMIRAGDLDDSTWICYLVNFEDLTPGRHVILDAGDVGTVRVKYDIAWMPELLSYVSRLKQPIGSVWSRTCRAIFGTPANSQTGCGVDITPLWVSGTIQSVGSETDRIFVGDEVSGDSSSVTPAPGRVQFLTGDNAGREYAVDEINGLEVTLVETTAYPMQIGDTYRIRPDCRKQYERDCIGVWDNGPNFKGEPHIPTGDALQGQTPAAQLSGGGGQKFIPSGG